MTNKWLIMAAGFLAGLGCALLFALAVQAQTPTPTVVCPPGATPGPTACPANNCGCCVGDADKNGFVNSTDFARIIDHFGDTAPTLGLGDGNCDGFVNYSDYGATQSTFGRGCPVGF